MSAKPKDDAVAKQSYLFANDMDNERPEIVEMVQAKSFIHSGAFVGANEELCRGVCEDLILGMSSRQIARKHHISRNSILNCKVAMAERGELEPLEKEIMAKIDRGVILSLENYQAALEQDKVAPDRIPIGLGILLDKRQLLSGQATSRHEVLEKKQLTPEDMATWLDEMKVVEAETAEPIDQVASAQDAEQPETGDK
jgi:hypothetical protein